MTKTIGNKKAIQFDGNKMLHHLDRVNVWMNDEIIYPIYVAFSPSSLCNHKCTFCVYHYKEFKPIYFPKDKYLSLIDEFKSKGIRSMFFAGDGDPLLNKDCMEMVQYTKESGIDVAMNTNGRLMREGDEYIMAKNLEWIRFSVNAGTKESYAEIHQTNENDFEIVLNNIKRLVEAKKETGSPLAIGIQCVLLNENKDTIEELALRAKEIGVDYLAVKPFLKHPETKWTCELDNKDEVLKVLTKLHGLNSDTFQFLLREANFKEFQGRDYKSCLSGRFMIEIDAKGDVYSCGPYIGNKSHVYGNVLENSFEDVWKSEECQSRIKEIQENLDVSKCMPNCRPNSVNSFLWNLKNPPKHKNFI